MVISQSQLNHLEKIAKLIRYWILKSTTEAGSGHPTSSLSAVELMTALMFGGFFRADLEHPESPNNDRLIFSKGHAAPLLYSLYAAADKLESQHNSPHPSLTLREGERHEFPPLKLRGGRRGVMNGFVTEKELMTLRKFGSRLEGHPSRAFPYTEAPTGSLGQGLSIGVGMALNAKYLAQLGYRTFVLLGDSEMAEGSVWEAIQIATHYRLDNLIGILDVNRLGERGETMYGHRVREYEKRIKAFGWNTVVVKDGNDMKQVMEAYRGALRQAQGDPGPVMIVAKTLKGKGVSFLENKEGKHGKALSKEDCEKAIQELGEIEKDIRGVIVSPKMTNDQLPMTNKIQTTNPKLNYSLTTNHYSLGDLIATRDAYGSALVKLGEMNPDIVVLDAELSDSTRSEQFKRFFPERFFEMYIAEQNMVGVAEGLALRGKIPFLSTFAAFFTRAFDQIRMAGYAVGERRGNTATRNNAEQRGSFLMVFVGSHGGVSVGQDGPSQMGLEDIAMFRAIQNSVVLYPSDAVSAEALVKTALDHQGIVYLRTTREKTPVVYHPSETFPLGGSKILRSSKRDVVTVVAAGITVREALAAHDMLLKQGTNIRVVDVYSVKPIDEKTLRLCAKETKAMIVVEDHVAEGGIADAVRVALYGDLSRRGGSRPDPTNGTISIYSLAVRKIPMSGTPDELLTFEEIDRGAIVKLVKRIASRL